MNISLRPVFASLVLSTAGISTMTAAHAGCGFAPPALKPQAWKPAEQLIALHPAVYLMGDNEGRFVLTDDDRGRREEAAIVGMWRFELVAPNGVVVDDGYAQWHSDGTELQNSGVHAPITSNFCMGVWAEIGYRTYKLAHFPLAWDAAGQASAVSIQLNETVKLVDDNHMEGTFTLNAYPWDSTKGLVVSGPAVQTVSGTITAERVTISSTVPGAP